jgi:hypothetical protein
MPPLSSRGLGRGLFKEKGKNVIEQLENLGYWINDVE